MEIRLEYRNRVPSDKPDRDHRSELKQRIRLKFSDQLRRKWRDSPLLSEHQRIKAPHEHLGPGFPEGYQWEPDERRGIIKRHYRPEDRNQPFFRVQMCGYSWVPLVSWHNYLNCRLDITFHGEGHSTVRPEGDLDNRVKTLFDALRMPLRESEVPGSMFGKGGELAYCLLEDDSLIREFCVRSVPSPYSPPEHSVQVVATVITVDGYEPHPALERFR